MKKPNVLKEILQFKQKEVKERKKQVPLEELKKLAEEKEVRDFRAEISARKRPLNLIAEVKRACPSQGLIRQNFELEKVVEIYSRHAQAISVLTDEKFFQGKLEYLENTKELTKLPVLRKDFIIDEYQVFESKAFGADAILLIAGALSKDRLRKLYGTAKSIGLQCLVEVHDSADVEKVLPAKPEIIGINNRDLETLATSINTTTRLRNLLPGNSTIVSESGFGSESDLAQVKGKVDAVLIGTAFMKEKDIEAKILEMGF